MEMQQGIVFDMDGVLFDTERVGGMIWRQVAAEMHFAGG
jgi:beta-phosphoglucomutase-like phosphatase (HAD superfamily)